MSAGPERGLTLVELLLALGLLGSIGLAVLSFTTTAEKSTATLAPKVRWQAAAAATLRLIEDDLSTGDFLGKKVAKVAVDGERLTIDTRSGSCGPVRQLYELDHASRLLSRVEMHGDGWSGEERVVRPLLDGVTRWQVVLDVEGKRLDVVLQGESGLAASRGFAVQ